ncbi:hypothetical protein [Burkholderia ambifaria]|nr:hypothetical protein [Burkholderia ambifaria]
MKSSPSNRLSVARLIPRAPGKAPHGLLRDEVKLIIGLLFLT